MIGIIGYFPLCSPTINIKIKGMPQGLFCLKEEERDAVRFTDEHIFPAALGGNLVVKDGSCDCCNHGNSKFEQALAVELTPMRMLLQIPDRYGKVPHTTATIVTPEKTYDGHVKGDGSVIVKPLVTEDGLMCLLPGSTSEMACGR